VVKERALLGEGGADSHSLLFKAADAGIRMAAPHLAVPKGLACYQAGVTYFHGGLSPQECVLPVLDVVLKAQRKEQNPQRAEISLTYRGRTSGTVTALIPTLELAYPAADLFGPATVRVLLQGIDKSGKIIAVAGSSAVVEPDSKEVSLERGKAVKVPLRIQEGFEGGFKAVALDPATGATLATIKLETAFHH
jgi:hypothetical protein